MKNLTISLFLLLLMACSKGGDIQISKQLNEDIQIAPDYKEVTIPQNIAPLNFQTDLKNPTCLIIEGAGSHITVHAEEGVFQIPIDDWKDLLAANAGKSIQFTVCEQVNGAWQSYKPFHMEVAKEEADPYLAYRMLVSCYGQWNQMGIYQRNIENYDESAIYENRLTDNNCINCHTFPNQDPNTMLLHMRAKAAGTLIMKDGKMEKLLTKTDETISNLTYPYWHPSQKYVVGSVNTVLQNTFYHQQNTLEVYDTESDVVVYDVEKHEMFSCDALKNDSAFETFPTFSPDGKSLYYLTAKARKMPEGYKDLKYSLCRIDFNPDTRALGTKVDTIYNAEKEGKSISFPRISPDGKLMVVGVQEYGNFSAWHKDCDLYAYRFSDGAFYPLKEANSNDSESYHSWSSNSHWMVFSSRRLDGLYTRVYMTYIDDKGQARKAFLLPQKNPVKYYHDLMEAYNLPEFIKGKVDVNPHDIASFMTQSEGIQIKYVDTK